jgi:hypothetical protein
MIEPHCKGNPFYVFLFWELRSLSPNFHIHVSVNDVLYIVPGLVHIFPPAEEADRLWEKYISHRHMNVKIGTETPIFLF